MKREFQKKPEIDFNSFQAELSSLQLKLKSRHSLSTLSKSERDFKMLPLNMKPIQSITQFKNEYKCFEEEEDPYQDRAGQVTRLLQTRESTVVDQSIPLPKIILKSRDINHSNQTRNENLEPQKNVILSRSSSLRQKEDESCQVVI